MATLRSALDPVADLRRRLSKSTSPATVRAWWKEHGFADHPAAVGKRVALALLAQRRTDEKLAGILVLGELLGDQLRATDLSAFAQLFEAGQLDDVTDAFAAKVLAVLLARAPGRGDVARQLAAWRDADTTWQRRAACLAFVKLASDLADHVIAICSTVVWSHERADQTAVGTVLRALPPARVEAFVRRHAQLMSRECARLALAKHPQRTALLVHHKRATTIRQR